MIVLQKSNKLAELQEIYNDPLFEYVVCEWLYTGPGKAETCGGCTLGDGQDCSLPHHYIKHYLVIGRRVINFGEVHLKYATYLEGYTEGGNSCGNSFGNVDKRFSVDMYVVEKTNTDSLDVIKTLYTENEYLNFCKNKRF